MKPGTSVLRSKRLWDQVRERIRYLHYSLSTEKACLHWGAFSSGGTGVAGGCGTRATWVRCRLNPDFPLDAPAVLLGRQRCICGHFGPSSSPIATAMDSSVGTQLPRNCPRCHPKPEWEIWVEAFLAMWASERHVSASTHNQALSAPHSHPFGSKPAPTTDFVPHLPLRPQCSACIRDSKAIVHSLLNR